MPPRSSPQPRLRGSARLWPRPRTADHVRVFVNARRGTGGGRRRGAPRSRGRRRHRTRQSRLVNLGSRRPSRSAGGAGASGAARQLLDPALHAHGRRASVGRPEDAIVSYRVALDIQPGDVLLRLAIGTPHRTRSAGRVRRLVRGGRVTRHRPGTRGCARFNEGNMRYRQDRLDEAITVYEAALAPTPAMPAPGAGSARPGGPRWLDRRTTLVIPRNACARFRRVSMRSS